MFVYCFVLPSPTPLVSFPPCRVPWQRIQKIKTKRRREANATTVAASRAAETPEEKERRREENTATKAASIEASTPDVQERGKEAKNGCMQEPALEGKWKVCILLQFSHGLCFWSNRFYWLIVNYLQALWCDEMDRTSSRDMLQQWQGSAHPNECSSWAS